MCESLEASLSLSLETFIGTELEEATRLKNEAEEMTDSAESSFAKYLHGKNAQQHSTSTSSSSSNNHNSGISNINSHNPSNDNTDGMEQTTQNTVSSSWNKISEGVGNQLGRMGISSSNNNENNGTSSPSKGRKSKNNNNDKYNKDPTDKAISAACLRQNLEEIRYAQANSELKRFQLLKHVDSLKVRYLHIFCLFLNIHS